VRVFDVLAGPSSRSTFCMQVTGWSRGSGGIWRWRGSSCRMPGSLSGSQRRQTLSDAGRRQAIVGAVRWLFRRYQATAGDGSAAPVQRRVSGSASADVARRRLASRLPAETSGDPRSDVIRGGRKATRVRARHIIACPVECDRHGRGPIAAGCGPCWHQMEAGPVPRSRCQRLRFVRG
jgi:hypothetical protein